MNKITLLISVVAVVLLTHQTVLAKGKGRIQEKHESQSRLENTNRQSLEDSYRGQERAEERHQMHEQDQSGQPRYRVENPVDTIIDRSRTGAEDLNRRAVDGMDQGVTDIAPPPKPRRR